MGRPLIAELLEEPGQAEQGPDRRDQPDGGLRRAPPILDHRPEGEPRQGAEESQAEPRGQRRAIAQRDKERRRQRSHRHRVKEPVGTLGGRQRRPPGDADVRGQVAQRQRSRTDECPLRVVAAIRAQEKPSRQMHRGGQQGWHEDSGEQDLLPQHRRFLDSFPLDPDRFPYSAAASTEIVSWTSVPSPSGTAM